MPANDDEEMATNEGARRRRVIYRATHRGTREMDFLLGRYADWAVPVMSLDDLALFEELIELPDPLLSGAFIDGAGGVRPDLARLIGRINAFHTHDPSHKHEQRQE